MMWNMFLKFFKHVLLLWKDTFVFEKKNVIHDIMFTCVNLHNMIIEDEHDLSAPVVVGREVSTLEVKIAEDETTWFQKFLSRFRWIKDKKAHLSLWNELINHLWGKILLLK